MFDRHAFLGHFGSMANVDGLYQPHLDKDEVAVSIDDDNPTLASTTGAVADTEAVAGDASINDLTIKQGAFFSDQVLPFDVTLAAANEYGALAVMRIYGCEILNEGYGVSIDDIVSEQQMSYVARTIAPWKALEAKD